MITNPFVPRVGGIQSADIAVPEHEREVRFYSRVLTTGRSPLWRDDLINSLGVPIIGLGARVPEYAHLPLQWMPHIQVADVAASVQRSLDLGGSELMHGRDEEGTSQWAVLLDPNGAAFGIIPVVPLEAVSPMGSASRDAEIRSGHISWLRLTASNASEARNFYRAVIGWSAQEIEMEDERGRYADFTLLGGDGTPAAGICHDRGANQGLPPIWLIFLPVGDLSESLLRVEEGGGKILKEAVGNDKGSVQAVVQDPIGVCLGLVQG